METNKRWAGLNIQRGALAGTRHAAQQQMTPRTKVILFSLAGAMELNYYEDAGLSEDLSGMPIRRRGALRCRGLTHMHELRGDPPRDHGERDTGRICHMKNM